MQGQLRHACICMSGLLDDVLNNSVTCCHSPVISPVMLLSCSNVTGCHVTLDGLLRWYGGIFRHGNDNLTHLQKTLRSNMQAATLTNINMSIQQQSSPNNKRHMPAAQRIVRCATPTNSTQHAADLLQPPLHTVFRGLPGGLRTALPWEDRGTAAAACCGRRGCGRLICKLSCCWRRADVGSCHQLLAPSCGRQRGCRSAFGELGAAGRDCSTSAACVCDARRHKQHGDDGAGKRRMAMKHWHCNGTWATWATITCVQRLIGQRWCSAQLECRRTLATWPWRHNRISTRRLLP